MRLLVAAMVFVGVITASAVWIVHYLLVEQSRPVIQVHDLPLDQIREGAGWDVTAIVRAKVEDNSLSIVANSDSLGHSADHAARTLRVHYTISDSPGVRSAKENELLTITAAPGKKLELQNAEFRVLPPTKDTVAAGDLGPPAGIADVTELVRRTVQDSGLTIKADNGILGDPSGGKIKTLRVTYMLDGSLRVRLASEGQMLSIATNPGQKLEIQNAFYGAGLSQIDKPPPGAKTADVSQVLQESVQNNALVIAVTNGLFGDPAEGAPKTLRVEYTIDGSPGVRFAAENSSLSFVAAPGKKLIIQNAVYGALVPQTDQRAAGDVGTSGAIGGSDVTLILRKAVINNKLSITATNSTLGGDPAYGLDKRLNVQYTVAGKPHITSIGEGKTLIIPIGGDGDGLLVIVKATWGPA